MEEESDLSSPARTPSSSDVRYLELLKRVLTRYHFEQEPQFVEIRTGSRKRWVARVLASAMSHGPLALVERRPPTDWSLRELGQDWPSDAETMIGLKRLNQLDEAIRLIVSEDVPGDLVEAGVWRGGATIFMVAALETYGSLTRTVYAADSFQGLPAPSADYPVDSGDLHHSIELLSVPRSEVEANFRRYGLRTDNVVFVEGWFRDTLHKIPAERIALLRLDGDMYESTIQTLDALYDKVSPGGFVIVDDYSLVGAYQAVQDFLASRDERPDIHDIDGSGAYWRV